MGILYLLENTAGIRIIFLRLPLPGKLQNILLIVFLKIVVLNV